MIRIASIHAREILDSRGEPTLETRIVLSSGATGVASVPSGASRGKHEAFDLRDREKKRFFGKGVRRAIQSIRRAITQKLVGKKMASLKLVDEIMIASDGTKDKSRFGANAILSVSMALARAFAKQRKIPLYVYLRKEYFPNMRIWKFPRCMMNVINGGIHAGWSTDIQEYMIVPSQKKISEQVQCGSEIFHILQKWFLAHSLAVTVGDEGGYAYRGQGNNKPLELLAKAVQSAGYGYGKEVMVAIDSAASEFFRRRTYTLKTEQRRLTSSGMVDRYSRWVRQHPIISIEDGLSEDDWEGWQMLTKRLGKKVLLVGDDLFVTNVDRIQKGIALGVANAVLIKINQIGTVTESANAINLSRSHRYAVIVSHRSGETNDSFISDLAVACSADFLKAGAPSRGERVAKYNRLMEIEQEIK